MHDVVVSPKIANKYGYDGPAMAILRIADIGVDREKLTKTAAWIFDHVQTTQHIDDASGLTVVCHRFHYENFADRLAEAIISDFEESRERADAIFKRTENEIRVYGTHDCWTEHPVIRWQWSVWREGSFEDWLNAEARRIRVIGIPTRAGLQGELIPRSLAESISRSLTEYMDERGYINNRIESYEGHDSL